MIEEIWRGLFFHLKIDVDGVSLIGTDSLTVIGEAKAWFVTLGDDLFKKGVVDLLAISDHASEEFVHLGPAFGIQSEIDRAGIVPEDEAQGSADFGILFTQGFGCLGVRSLPLFFRSSCSRS